MNLYQSLYGEGGQGSDLLENLVQCVCQILPTRKDLLITNKLNITVMQDDFQNNTGLFAERAAYPEIRSEYIFEFGQADVPNSIQYDALIGKHIMENYHLYVETDGPRFFIVEESPILAISLSIKCDCNRG
jgi:hypothetical protein